MQWWTQDAWPWLSGWLESPGFAGAVALVAAAVTIRVTLQRNRHDTWWEQTEWALAKYVNRGASNEERAIGRQAARVLIDSPLATRHETAFLSAVLSETVIKRRGSHDNDEPGELLAKPAEVLENESAPEEES